MLTTLVQTDPVYVNFSVPEVDYLKLARDVLDALKRVPGTTNVQILGAKDYAMRIWMRPDRMA